METLFKYALDLHIAAGTTGLVMAPLAMVTVKGAKAHRLWGKIFFWAMCAVAISAVILSCIHVNFFLLAVAFFSFQLAGNGYRAIYHKPVRGVITITWVDWLIVAFGVTSGLGLIGIGAYLLMRNGSFGYVSLVFGTISILTALQAAYTYRRPPSDPKAWWFAHMRGMLASYIAMVTAFSAVNFMFLPVVVRWLWPTAVIVPLMVVWITYYKFKFARAAKAKLQPAAA
jgi:uncharacterized membrane protein